MKGSLKYTKTSETKSSKKQVEEDAMFDQEELDKGDEFMAVKRKPYFAHVIFNQLINFVVYL